jgi:AbrB family looped-hinge helix DNA binding protein
MTFATLTSKGRITISNSVREGLRLHTGDKVEFILSDGEEARFRLVIRKMDSGSTNSIPRTYPNPYRCANPSSRSLADRSHRTPPAGFRPYLRPAPRGIEDSALRILV